MMHSLQRLLLSLLIVCVFAPLAFAETRLSNQLPPSHFLSKAMDLYAEKVAEYSGGKEKVQVFHSGQLFQDTGIVEAIQDGLVELALLPVNKWVGMLPAVDIFEMPFLFKDGDSLHRFLDGGGSKVLDEQFQKLDVKVMFWVDYGTVHFFNNVRPLIAKKDFDGVKIRTFSKASAETVEALGGSPVIISSAEMYMALQRGTVDGAATGTPAAVSRKVYEVQKYMTVAGFNTAEFVVQANLDWWKGLSPELQKAHTRASQEVAAHISQIVAEEEAKALDVVKKAGVQVHVPTEAELKALKDATVSVRDAFAKASGTVGKELLDINAKANQ